MCKDKSHPNFSEVAQLEFLMLPREDQVFGQQTRRIPNGEAGLSSCSNREAKMSQEVKVENTVGWKPCSQVPKFVILSILKGNATDCHNWILFSFQIIQKILIICLVLFNLEYKLSIHYVFLQNLTLRHEYVCYIYLSCIVET